MSFDPTKMPREEFEDRVSHLEAKVEESKQVLASATAQLDWWRRGLGLFFPEAVTDPPVQDPTAEDETGRAEEIMPPAAVFHPNGGSKPTLRQAIHAIMAESPAIQWRATDLFSALGQRGWMPTGKNAEDVVRGMLSSMNREKQIMRVGYGVYALPDRVPELASQLSGGGE